MNTMNRFEAGSGVPKFEDRTLARLVRDPAAFEEKFGVPPIDAIDQNGKIKEEYVGVMKGENPWTSPEYAQQPDLEAMLEAEGNWITAYEEGVLHPVEQRKQDLIAIATQDFHDENMIGRPDLFGRYRGWRVEDFEELFERLGYEVPDIRKLRKEAEQRREDRSFEAFWDVATLTNPHTPAFLKEYTLDKFAEAVAKDPAVFHEVENEIKSSDYARPTLLAELRERCADEFDKAA